jgi:hypothetical protein
VQECNPFPLRPDPWRLINEPDPRSSAPVQNLVKIVYGKADVMYAGTTFIDEPGYRIVARIWFEQLNEGFTGLKAGDSGAIGIV